MAYNSALNLSDERWVATSRTGATGRGMNVTPELFAIAIPENDNIPAGDSGLPVPGALRQVFQSDGMQAVITFPTRSNLNSGFNSNPVLTPMRARVLPVSWEQLVARVGTLLDASRKNSAVTRFGDNRRVKAPSRLHS